ncbi:MAG TPA: YqeG family HAD IIIA-type phosphatase [Firmicutes bacterium]|nr:YqeG family HAD IIIA-type phosphatase [Bacillota bacterium]
MLKWFCPDLVLDSIYDLDLELLKKRGIKGIITDLDNTLVAWNDYTLEGPLKDWFKALRDSNIKICILSNSTSSKVADFAAKLGIPAVTKAVKPRRGGFRQSLLQMGLKAEETAVLGDQLFTDILGGNRTGLFTIWVKPISQNEFYGTKITRFFEKRLIKVLKSKGFIKTN